MSQEPPPHGPTAPSDRIRPLPDPAATEALGGALARVLRRGDVVALRGDLGAGKTALARAIIRAWSDDPDIDVPSPTFTLVQGYDGADGVPLTHYDLYRLTHPDEALELDLEDALDIGVTLIEWPDRLGPLLPRDRLDVTLTITGPESRDAMLSPRGAWTGRTADLAILTERVRP